MTNVAPKFILTTTIMYYLLVSINPLHKEYMIVIYIHSLLLNVIVQELKVIISIA